MTQIHKFTVRTTVDFGHFIGTANILIRAADAQDFEIDSVEAASPHASAYMEPEQLDQAAYAEVAELVREYFASLAEQQLPEGI